MTIPRYDDIRDLPLRTDAELIPQLTAALEGGYRRQVWVMLLDDESRLLPVVVPTDVSVEPTWDDVVGFADFLSCLSLDFHSATLVITYERPGPTDRTARDRRWLRVLREACVESGMPFRGPYLLTGAKVRQVPPDDYLTVALIEPEEEDDLEGDL
jgi:hypothetical protein